jgi:hypothetical protein
MDQVTNDNQAIEYGPLQFLGVLMLYYIRYPFIWLVARLFGMTVDELINGGSRGLTDDIE